MRISVVIPSYNRAGSLPSALLSAAHQTRPPEEIILVDDGSTDGTEAVVARLGLPGLRYIRQGNAGGGAARNAGVAAARGDWIAFHDSDDVWLPHKLERLAAARERHAAAAPEVIFSAFSLFDPARRRLRLMPEALARRRGASLLLEEPLREARALTANPISTQTLLVSRAAFARAGGFDPALRRFQDWDLALRLAGEAPWAYVPEPLVHVALSPNSVTRDHAAGLAARRRLLDAHAGLYARAGGALWRARADLWLRRLAGALGRAGA
ncbi:glycosyltransferase family 2 protein [Pseudoroseicyclus tamaricis]|uniref:Glycosyltransferase family 2 protein n=1 Tax=Pseudoroseicyclus tamaricis TaxID=2705421 RepID=A0A6B2JFP5_9RHOB|nr:glycosyltransferase family A protein [Pseudoroseicyclus tamaricis]NDU99872.1 glycosyltransferase family 2 protein [Pseudoroseicyclus tamaricis]